MATRTINPTIIFAEMNNQYTHTVLATLALLVAGLMASAQSLSLEDCRKMALAQNRKLQAARLEVEAAQSLKQSVNANAYPSVDGSVLGLYLGEPLGGAMDGLIPEYTANGSVSVTQPIYAGRKIKNGRRAAAKGVELSEAQQAAATADVLFEVERSYWQVVQAAEKIVLAHRFSAMLQVLHHDLKNSYDAGLIYKNDLLRVEVSLNEAELNSVRAQDAQVLAKLRLAQIIGSADSVYFTLTDTTFAALPDPIAAMTNVENRPEIRMLQRALEIETIQGDILRGDRRPTLGVSASGVAAVGPNVNISNGDDFMTTYYGVASISFPIYDWGRKSNKVKEHTLRVSAQKQRLEETKELVSLEIQSAYLQWTQAARKLQTSALSVQQAEENLRLANDRFEAGTITGKDVQEAVLIWEQARNSMVDAHVEWKIHAAAYKKATGALE
jgi:outer membrane protein TolC